MSPPTPVPGPACPASRSRSPGQSWRSTLVEPRQARSAFLELAVERLGLTNVKVTHGRVESLGTEAFDAGLRPGLRSPTRRMGATPRAPRPRWPARLLRRRRRGGTDRARRSRFDRGAPYARACNVRAAHYHWPPVTERTAPRAARASSTSASKKTRAGRTPKRQGEGPRHPTESEQAAQRARTPSPHHRRRQPEGRRRQEHYRGQPRRVPGRARQTGAGHRPRPAGQRVDRPRDPPRGEGGHDL